MLKKFFTQLKKYKLRVKQRFININIFHLKITLIACVKNGYYHFRNIKNEGVISIKLKSNSKNIL